MKKWVLIITGIIVFLFVVGYLYEKGLLDFGWQTLTIIIAALAAPFKWIKDSLFGDPIELIRKRHNEVRSMEQKYREELDASLQEKEYKINLLKKDVDLIDSRLALLKIRSQKVDQNVASMSLDEKKKLFEELYGTG